MAKIDNIYDAVDDFGLITSSEAANLGMSNAELVQQAAKGKLIRVARGVYRMPVWPSQPQAPYAIAVKAVGDEAFLYGESVIALLELAPSNPQRIWIATPKRVRRDLGEGVEIIHAEGVEPVLIEGVACQPLVDALVSAAQTMGAKRAQDAAQEAFQKGLISSSELKGIESELLTDLGGR